jgi:hypothetical protein
MHKARKLVVAAIFVAASALRRARPLPLRQPLRSEKERVLRRLDEAAANFHSTSADFEFDTVETDPIPDKDVQKGTVYYERKTARTSRWPRTSAKLNGKKLEKVYSYSGGVFKLYEKLTNQVTTYSQGEQVRELPDAGLRRQRQRSGAEVGDQVPGPGDARRRQDREAGTGGQRPRRAQEHSPR